MATSEPTVKDIFQLDLDLLTEKSEESYYWKSCCDFYEKVMYKPYGSLTEKQIEWLEKIQENL